MTTTDPLDLRPMAVPRVALVVLAVIGVSGDAHAERNELGLGPSLRALRTDSANALTDQSFAGPAVSYARELGLELVPRLQLFAAAGIAGGGVDGEMFQSMATHVRQLSFTVGGRARYALHRLVAATARVDVGAARTSLELDMVGRTASDHGWGAITTAALGCELVSRMPRHASIQLGIRLELGYVATTAVSLTPRVANGDDTIELPAMESPIGQLSLSGPSFDLVVFSRF
ncbi:MAG: hypothetical protein AB7P03_15055 [Kofleriaceae bacterium]